LRVGRAPAHFAIVYRVMQSVRPWGMVEVFMLGVLVSLVKLAHLAGIVPGAALGAFAVLMFVMAAIAAVFDPRDLWARLAAVESTRHAQRHVDDRHGAGVPS
jgi:paraquat-inducible protein A